jgi:hypothetical protein
MPGPHPQSPLQRLTIIALMLAGFLVLIGIALFGKERVGAFFSGSLKFAWIGVLLAIGYFSAHLRR